jgi:hypothetical protein
VVIYLEDEDYAVLSARAKRTGESENLCAKDILLKSLKKDDDGLLQALNVLATAVGEIGETVARLERNAAKDFHQIGEMMNEVLDKLEEKGR